MRHEENGVKLGTWVHWQRQLYKKGKLDESYQQRLENLGMTWDPYAEQWEHYFALLEHFNMREGHCNIPHSYEEEGVKLGAWISRQRLLYKNGKLDESYQRRLESLGMSWDPLADHWERNYGLLEQYKEREGHCNVPPFYEEDGVKLGRWLINLRQARKGNLSYTLSSDRIERLDQVGMRW